MAVNTRVGVGTRNAMLDTIPTTIGSNGRLRIYDGTQPTDPDTALGAQVLLADLALSATFAPASSGGVLTANSITADSSADNTGTATWASLTTSAFARKIDCSVGTSSANVIINSVAISAGATVSCSSLTITMPMQGA
jgi:hypothetical protein